MTQNNYEVVIGLEVHAQLQTKSKLFCGCPTDFGSPPNTQTCPVCLGLPGVLPVLNKAAVDMIIKTGLALNCAVASHSIFARKNYYYPDLPKNYQISQYEIPICSEGYLEISTGEPRPQSGREARGEGGMKKKIRIRRIHLEEDAGKLVHLEGASSAVDFNRTGMPLMEIVTHPDISSPDEALEYLTKLQLILRYLGVSSAQMAEGSMRCEPNISLRKKGETELGTKTELKNLNSFNAVKLGLEYEMKRQSELLDSGQRVIQETRRFDEATGTTVVMRSKEEAHDYRYFPEPDLVPLSIGDQWTSEIRKTLPELPEEKKNRYVSALGLSEYDAGVLTGSASGSHYFESCVKVYNNPKTLSNWICNELFGLLNATGTSIEECKITPEDLVKLPQLMDKGTISGKIAKTVFQEMFKTGKPPEEIVKEKELVQISGEDEIVKLVEDVIRENPDVVEQIRSGNTKPMQFLVGQVMKKTAGKANPQVVNKVLREKI